MVEIFSAEIFTAEIFTVEPSLRSLHCGAFTAEPSLRTLTADLQRGNCPSRLPYLSLGARVPSKKMSVSEALFRCIKQRKVDRGVSHSGTRDHKSHIPTHAMQPNEYMHTISHTCQGTVTLLDAQCFFLQHKLRRYYYTMYMY